MIDLRSDTVTLPTPSMYAAMAEARLGDDMRERDPTVVELEMLAARLTGMEDGLYVASGTMGNLVSVLAHTGRGGELLCDPDAHIARSEIGGFAQVAGLFHRYYKAARGCPDIASLKPMLKEKITAGSLATGIVCIETSHNHAGGTVIPLSVLEELRDLTKEQHIPLHIDGARVFNAAVALGVPVSEIAKYTDSITFCVSKGLSAPVGSLVCGSAEFIQRARLFRRMLGGAMRQAGVIAAAGIVALNEMVPQLVEDNRRAKAIAEGVSRVDSRFVDPNMTETNIVMIDVGHTGVSPAGWIKAMGERNVDLRSYGATRLRLVVHRHIDDIAVEQVVAAFADFNAKLAC